MFRAIIIGIDNDFSYLVIKNSGNWTAFQKRLYRKDKEANLQVISEDGSLKNIVEAIYFEGISHPVGSNMKETDITAQIFREVHSQSFTMPQRSFLDILFRRK
jgi:hypothetical protein